MLARRLVEPGYVQQELHAVYFPHMLRTAELVATDINLVRKSLRELLARRYIQMPVDILENIYAGFKNRIIFMGVFVCDNRAVRLLMRKIALIHLNPVKDMRADSLTNTVKDFPYRESPNSFDIPR